MLAAEEARASLLAIADKDWLEAAQRRVRKLKRSLRRVAEPLLVLPPQGWNPKASQERYEKLSEAAIGLDKLSYKQLTAVLVAVHPETGATLASWWIAAQKQPYARGWTRLAFRAPSESAFTRERRITDLAGIISGIGPYAQSADWFAAWAPYLNVADRSAPVALEVGPFLAAAIDAGGVLGEKTFQTLVECGNGEHPIGGMGRHVIVGLLRSSRPDGWEFIESMLLAAQRQEGLRQSILEAADEAHPEAFTRIIDLVVKENLIRFAATIRAVSVWFGFREDVEHIDDVEQRLSLLQAFRLDRDLASKRLLEGDAWDTYAGLCALAQFDILPTLTLAHEALALPGRDNRASALRFLANSQLPRDYLLPIFAGMIADGDLAVASLAHRAMIRHDARSATVDVYDELESLAKRLPEKATTADAVGIDPEPVPLDRGAVVTTMVQVIDDRPLQPLLRFLPSMDPQTRAALAKKAGDREQLDGDLRNTIVRMVGDRSSFVRKNAVEAMNKLIPTTAEALKLEPLLTRKAGDLRRGVIGLLSKLPEVEVVPSAQRLWAGSEAQRDAACELLITIDRTDAVVAAAESFNDSELSTVQRDLLGPLLGEEAVDSADLTLGLYDLDQLTAPLVPSEVRKGREFFTDATAFFIAEALDDLAEAHRNTAFEMVHWQGSTERLLADVQGLPSPFNSSAPNSDGDGSGMILPHVFRTWWDERSDECRGASDSLDALRALVACQLCTDHEEVPYLLESQVEIRSLLRPLAGEGRLQLRHPIVVQHVLQWVLAEAADEAVIDECVDATEAALASVPNTWIDGLTRLEEDWRGYQNDWRRNFVMLCPWIALTGSLFRHKPFLLISGQLQQWYGLMRWLDQPTGGVSRFRMDTNLLHAAHAIGAASDADVYDDLVGQGRPGQWGGGRQLLEFTKRRRGFLEGRHPTIVPLADRARERTIEIELSRGELSTAASQVAFRLASIEGADIALELLARLGRSTLVRGYIWNNDGREAVYSRLIQISHPTPEDTPEVVAELVVRHQIKDRRLIDLAMFAPQWAPTVEGVLDWDGLEDAIWWFHAHTKDSRWSVEREVRETWAAMSAERTPLGAADLTDGAVDIEWFGRAHARLGAERWSILHKAAKLASGGSGHRRAQIFAESMLGELNEVDVIGRIKTKRHQDSVRALGLLPLPAKKAEEVALDRYQILREFERGSKKFGQQRQRSEATAVRIGIENLARSSGAADPQRFIWAMEAAEAGDLADGPISVQVDDVSVTLSVGTDGMADISVRRGEKKLKSVPAKLRKKSEVKALTDRKTALKRQASRVRRSLEDAMVRQDTFSEGDIVALSHHPVVAPMLELVIWTDDEGSAHQRRADGWTDVGGTSSSPAGGLRIAHPVDLLAMGGWIDWQEQFFDGVQRQPFKQAFRELYVLTNAEAASSPLSRRWSGHQLQPRQAQGLFTSRGWLSDREAGEVSKVFHHAGLVARVSFMDGWGTPAEVELPTIDTIYFTRRNEYLAQSLDSIAPIIFSETMRDLDLVVSVAHAGGVDPEATASTVEMRAALVRETVRLLQLDNVTQESSHIVIEGALGEYSIHLGSGTVHRRPGGALCIIPVDAQRRGRIFLPFADQDPKTAEIVSKVLLLARDSTIKDPTILEQLRS